jgi:hypothetical protein
VSTYWYLHCRTCNTTERVGWWNHGVDRGLREIRDALPQIAALANLGGCGFVEVRILGPEDTSGIIDFAQTHHAHDVVCKSEYGEVDGTCGERFACVCDRVLFCARPNGHEGQHSTNADGT